MTPEDTEDLAFEKARQSALEKFGAHVRSEQTLSKIETSEGLREMSQTRIAVLAAGNASLVDGSKQVRRKPTEETLVYEVRADFRIEPTDFENTLRAYQNVGGDSRLRRSVETAANLQEKLTQLDASNAESPEVRRLLSQTEGSYDAISSATQDLDGSSLRSDIAKQRQRRKNALLRYLRVVKKHGYPGDLLEFRLSKPDVKDQGGWVEFKYKTDYKLTDHAKKVSSSCNRTIPTWWPNEEGTLGRRTDGWIRKIFEDGSYIEIDKLAVIYILDENDNVLSVVSKWQRGSVDIEFGYTNCDVDRIFDGRLWEDEWEFGIPTEYIEEIESVTMKISPDNYWKTAKRSGFQHIDDGVWVRGGGQPVSLDRFIYSRKEFRKFIDSYAEKVKALPPDR